MVGTRWFAKRKPASRATSIFLVNLSLFSTSPIERVGWRWLWTRCFGASQGQSWGQCSMRDDCRCRCAGLTVPGNRPPAALRSNCRNPQKERLRQEVRGAARSVRVRVDGGVSGRCAVGSSLRDQPAV
jgi:hypothetical protein